MLLLANVLTGSRVVIAILLFYVLSKGMWGLALPLTIIGLLTDAGDGELARASKKPMSEARKAFGALFDGLADTLFALSLIVGLIVQGRLPWYVGVLMVGIVAAMPWIRKILKQSPWWPVHRHMHWIHPFGNDIFLAYAVGLMIWFAIDDKQIRTILLCLYGISALGLIYVKRRRAADYLAGPKD